MGECRRSSDARGARECSAHYVESALSARAPKRIRQSRCDALDGLDAALLRTMVAAAYTSRFGDVEPRSRIRTWHTRAVFIPDSPDALPNLALAGSDFAIID